ncbi:phosphoglycerate kinase [Candidatus Protochlamydia amoebophila]|uniref:Phosphoglycerate kinase n=1 Tax=Protochlamydia amoebophila (strain UWE25) TaxID=264201 RepID=Q6MEN6_PARUW|nr:unnamed protein product [Candidatus Protochlamydia amoebophila UWE25]
MRVKDKLSIRDLNLKDKKALIRVDFNVPLEKGLITDDSRIQASLPTIQYVLDQEGAVILMSHLGRPKGLFDSKFSLAPCAKRLSELLNKPVKMAADCCGLDVEQMVRQLKSGEVLLLENLRFHKGEERPDDEPNFTSALSELGDVYINDAFGTAHRAHASTTKIAKFFPNRAAAGLLLEKEISYLGCALTNPKRPFCAVLGGAKISTKFKVIEALQSKADVLLIGGAMAFTFFKSEGIPIGDSLYESEFVAVARELLGVETQSRCRLLLPIDLVIAKKMDESFTETRIISVKEGIPDGYQGVDIGPDTIKLYQEELNRAATIFWNGPLGVFEVPAFSKGTQTIAQTLAVVNAITIVGGGDSLAAIEQAGVSKQINHLSTGGGASLEYIEFGQLPGIEALSDK